MHPVRSMLAALAVAASASVPAPAMAQSGNPAGMKPATPQLAPGRPVPQEANYQDRLFVQLVGAGGMAEVDAGKLAGGRSGTDGVKAFAAQMVQDHGAAGTRLQSAAREAGIPWPGSLDPDHQAEKQLLESTPADQFDVAYLRAQAVDHQKTVQLLEWEIDSGQADGVRRFAVDSLPMVLDHLRHVQQLLASATGAPPQGLGALRSAP